MNPLKALGLYRVSEMIINSLEGSVIFRQADDPEKGIEVPLPSGKTVRGDVFFFRGLEGTSRKDIPKADYYIVIVNGPYEEPVRGIYSRRVSLIGKIDTIEVDELPRKSARILGVEVPLGRGERYAYLYVISYDPKALSRKITAVAYNKLKEDYNKLLAEKRELEGEVQKLRAENSTLRNELETTKSQQETCVQVMNRLRFELQEKVAEAEALARRARNAEKLYTEATRLIEKLVGEKSIFRSLKEKTELEEEIKRLKKEAESV